jgi:hypothetical protein
MDEINAEIGALIARGEYNFFKACDIVQKHSPGTDESGRRAIVYAACEKYRLETPAVTPTVRKPAVVAEPVTRSKTERSPEQQVYWEREQKRLQACAEKLPVKIEAADLPRSGWRRDPKVPDFAFHPSGIYRRRVATNGNEKLGNVKLVVFRGKAVYRVRVNGKRVDRYLLELMYDTGFSSWNVYAHRR